jgi:hypothetical protein
MTTAVRKAQRWVHVEIYIMAWDQTIDAFLGAMVDAVRRGVRCDSCTTTSGPGSTPVSAR